MFIVDKDPLLTIIANRLPDLIFLFPLNVLASALVHVTRMIFI